MAVITTPRDAELAAALKMRLLGFADAKATAIGPDAGIDVVAARALAQVKWEVSKTGRPALQRLYGARGARTDKDLYFFSLAGYSDHAIAYAQEHRMFLYLLRVDGSAVPANHFAQEKARFDEISRQSATVRTPAQESGHKIVHFLLLAGIIVCPIVFGWIGLVGSVIFLVALAVVGARNEEYLIRTGKKKIK